MMSTEEKSLQEVLGPVMRVLRDLDGQLVFRDEDGVEFVLMGREYLEELRGAKRRPSEAQLSFEAVQKGKAIEHIEEDEVDEMETGAAVEAESYDDLALIDEEEYPEESGVMGEVEVELGDSEAREDIEGSEMVFTSNRNQPQPPPVRVRFEPFAGDLPPQLQE